MVRAEKPDLALVDIRMPPGLMGLRDRVEALSGSLTVVSEPGAGTRITATIPLGERAEK